MSDNTNIEWTDHTFNPWWGCARVSPACRFCYADDVARRYGHELWRRKGPRRMLSDVNWAKPLKWNRDAERFGTPAKVFCASMADVFEDHPQVVEPRKRLWALIDKTPWLRWQLLTKRPENIAGMAPWGKSWPSNVWIGTSVENQRYAHERIPPLMQVPATVRFLSCEPLLASIDLTPWIGGPNGLALESGGRRISSGRDGRPLDRRTGSDLAPRLAQDNTLKTDGAGRLLTSASREGHGQVFPGTRNGRPTALPCTCAPPGLETLPWPDSERADGQSPEWRLERQQARQPGAGHLRGTASPRAIGSEARAHQSVGGEESLCEAHRTGRPDDLLTSSERREANHDCGGSRCCHANGFEDRERSAPIAWLICGGESGPRARTTELAWIRDLLEQCRSVGVAPFVKQLGSVWAKGNAPRDPKGGNPEHWPADLRVREFPQPVEAVAP